MKMQLDTQAALAALETWRSGLPNLPPDAEFGPPNWAFAELIPRAAYRMRPGVICYVYSFKKRQGTASGFVLNADWNKAQCIRGDSVQSLAAALSIATMRPAPTRANGRREV